MEDKKQKSAGGHTHEGEGGRVYQEHGPENGPENGGGHDLQNSDGFTSGVGTEVRTPSEARKIDEIRDNEDQKKNQI